MEDCLCEDCNNSLCNAKYVCSENDYRVLDETDNLLQIVSEHDMEGNDEEIGDYNYIQFCGNCLCCYDYPYSYDNNDHVFKTKKGDSIDYYSNFRGNNIIHNFTAVQCEHCSGIMNKGYFTMKIIEETEENLKKYSMPNDFIQELKIYNENQEFVQSFEPNDYNEYVELHTGIDQRNVDAILPPSIALSTPPTALGIEKSRKILYCSNCRFIILNNLKKIKVR